MKRHRILLLLALGLALWMQVPFAKGGVRVETLYSFSGPDGINPEGHLVQGPDGSLYGTARDTASLHGNSGFGLNGPGIVFKITTNGTFTNLLHFRGTNGAYPRSGMVLGSDGNLYGTTAGGGTGNDARLHYGTIFKMTLDGALTTIAAFHNDDGAAPFAELTECLDGSFLGVTPYGGRHVDGAPQNFSPGTGGFDFGTVFRLTPDHTLSSIMLFAKTNGQGPLHRLVKGVGESFYGTTESGGAHGRGTAFRISPNGQFETLFNFGGTNGVGPNELTFDDDGNLYGTTGMGGLGYHGTVFRLSPSGMFKTLACFDGKHGDIPVGALVLAADRNFYGTTASGGASNAGSIFQVTKSGILRSEYSFSKRGTFGNTTTTLTRSRDGAIYGTSAEGGQYGCGSIFRIILDSKIPDGAPIPQPRGLRPTNTMAVVGMVTNLEVWYRPSNDRQNAARLALYRYRTKDRDFYIQTYVASYETTLAGLAKAAEVTIAHARQLLKQEPAGTIPLIVFENHEVDSWDGNVETTSGGALFYADGLHRVPPNSREFSWEKYPGIPWTYGYSTNFEFHPEDVLAASIPLSWSAMAINHLTIEPDPAEPVIVPTNSSFSKLMGSRDVPLNFYGQTVAQDGKPLPGVQIQVRVRNWTAGGISIPYKCESDSSGRFNIHGVNGDAFDIESMSKEGYELEMTQRGYGAVGGSQVSPVLFRLWRNDINEPLISVKKAFEVVPDGRKYFIVMTNGAVSDKANGDEDFSISLNAPPNIRLGQRFDWSGTLQMLNGGGLREESVDYYMYIAPIDGYTNSAGFGEVATNKSWGGESGPKRYYISLRGGRVYGHMSFELYTYYNLTRSPRVRIEYAINPTGSRILK